MEYVKFEELEGKTFSKIDVVAGYEEDSITFICEDGTKYRMYHFQDCCESVTIEDITGDIDLLIGCPILEAVESSEESETDWGTQTWTFYKLATMKGWVDIRWHGESNGYYSESVNLVKVD